MADKEEKDKKKKLTFSKFKPKEADEEEKDTSEDEEESGKKKKKKGFPFKKKDEEGKKPKPGEDADKGDEDPEKKEALDKIDEIEGDEDEEGEPKEGDEDEGEEGKESPLEKPEEGEEGDEKPEDFQEAPPGGPAGPQANVIISKVQIGDTIVIDEKEAEVIAIGKDGVTAKGENDIRYQVLHEDVVTPEEANAKGELDGKEKEGELKSPAETKEGEADKDKDKSQEKEGDKKGEEGKELGTPKEGQTTANLVLKDMKLSLTASFKDKVDNFPNDEDGKPHNHFVITVQTEKGKEDFDYYDSNANFEAKKQTLDEPDVKEAFNSILQDANDATKTFEDFVGALGLKTQDRAKAKKIYEVAVENLNKLLKLGIKREDLESLVEEFGKQNPSEKK